MHPHHPAEVAAAPAEVRRQVRCRLDPREGEPNRPHQKGKADHRRGEGRPFTIEDEPHAKPRIEQPADPAARRPTPRWTWA